MQPRAPHPADTIGTCDESTLRTAIALALPGATVQFTCSGTITLSAANGPIAISKNLTLDGNGQAVTISGGGAVGLFVVTTGGNFTIRGLTLANGYSALGGAIRNVGDLTVLDSTFTGNAAVYTGATGIYDGDGGAIYNSQNAGTLTVVNSTFSGNSATGGGGDAEAGIGGAIFNWTYLSVTNSTFSGNSASSYGGGIEAWWDSVTMTNTILANNAGGNCNVSLGFLQDGGGNLEDGSTCGFTSASSRANTNPLLAPLGNYGGPTQTLAPLPGSPASDWVAPGACTLTTDQRGFPRPDEAADNGYCDSGAVDGPAPGPPSCGVATGNMVGDCGFETPVVGEQQFQYGPTGSPWTFANGSGISGNFSGFTAGNPPAPEGFQVAFIQGTGTVAQPIAGFQDYTVYQLSFDAAQRGTGNNGGQDVAVYLDSTQLGTFTPSGASYMTQTIGPFVTMAGTHTLEFVGLDTAGGDNTALIDNVALTAVGTVPTPTDTPVPTNTPTNTPTDTPTNTPTATNTPTSTPTPRALLALSPPVNLVFGTEALTGTAFGAGDSVSLFLDSVHTTPLTTTAASSAGSFAIHLTVPQAISGTHTLIAVGLPSGRAAGALLRIKPRLLLGPTSGAPGQAVFAAGFGFTQETVAVYWDKPPQLLGTRAANALGSFAQSTALSFTVPLSASVGTHLVYGVGLRSHAVGGAVFTVH